VVAVCGGIKGKGVSLDERRAAARAKPTDEDGTIIDTLRVTQEPLSIAVSDDEVEVGDEVTATFNRCQDENDFGLFDPDPAPVAEREPLDEAATDFPDLQVLLDGELVSTIAGDERYPTGTVDVPMELTEVGDHEIIGVCTFQTVAVDLEVLAKLLSGVREGGLISERMSVGAAAVDYPIVEGPFTIDEATTKAAALVSVVAPAVGSSGAQPVPDQPVPVQPVPAQPVLAQPSYTG